MLPLLYQKPAMGNTFFEQELSVPRRAGDGKTAAAWPGYIVVAEGLGASWFAAVQGLIPTDESEH